MQNRAMLGSTGHWGYRLGLLLLVMTFSSLTQAGTPKIEKAKYEDGDNQLVVKVVKTGRRAMVTIKSDGSGKALARFRANKKGKLEQKIRLSNGQPVPCLVIASTDAGSTTKRVSEAPTNCDSGNLDNGGNPGSDIAEHQDLTYTGPGTCLECHNNHALDVFDSTHYQWKGIASYMWNQPGSIQGKHAGAVNTYCGNILGNWTGCSTCHVGRGAEPELTPSVAQLQNIDCLICHQEGYKRKRINGVMQPDTANMSITMDQAVRTVHEPTRTTCLQCHAKAGGGDALKRGDLALATGITSDKRYDVHMATTGANLTCQACHMPENHRFPGKGSDLRPTDLDVALDCSSSSCHSSSPHDSQDLNRHTARVACQTCHIPVYGKNANDSPADEATEIHRSWQEGSDHNVSPLHPIVTKANDLVPVYRHWNGTSDNYLLYDPILPNAITGRYETSLPVGSVDDAESKLYPFKYKTSDYPIRTASDQLIALDTSVFFATADGDAAAMFGLENMGFNASDDYKWVTTDTYQLLNHQVSPHDDALGCSACHANTSRIDLQGDLGYAPKDSSWATCSSGCHSAEKAREWSYGRVAEFKEGHKKHREKGIACIECHSFSR